GDPRPSRAEGRRGGARGGRGRQGLIPPAEQRERANASMRPRVAPLLPSVAGPRRRARAGTRMTRKSISTNTPVVNCDVCGRTLLPGETPSVFLAAGEKRNVCELCTQRASHEGWIREGLDDATVRTRGHNGRSRGLVLRFRRP